MGLLTFPLRLPLLPVEGVVRIAEAIQEEAESELHDPAAVQRELEEAERAHEAGEISDEELARWQQEALSRLTSVRDPTQDGL
jgi:hypothetical protein